MEDHFLSLIMAGHYRGRTPVQIANIGSICLKTSKTHIPKIMCIHLTLVNKKISRTAPEDNGHLYSYLPSVVGVVGGSIMSVV